MTYTKQQIDRINSGRLAEEGKIYTQDNGLVWIGLYSKRLELFEGSPALPVGASTDATLAERTTPNDTQPVSSVDLGVKADSAASSDTGTFSLISLFKRLLEKFTTLNTKDFSTSAKQDLLLAELQLKADLTDTQPVSISGTLPLPIGSATEAKQDSQLTAIQDILNRNNGTFDAFYRQRFSQPETIFDSKQLSDKQPLFWDDQLISGSGGASTYNTNQASTTLSVANLTAGRRVRQTFRRFNYQPGKSQLWIMTGIFGTAATGIKRKIGLFDQKNGLFFDQQSTGMGITVRSYTSGSAVDTRVAQSDWNIDKMDGTGPSGITLDWSKCEIVFGDYEWLGVGTKRWGVFVGGRPYYVHEINNANNSTLVYMSVPNLPLRYEIENDGTGAAASLTHICSTVISEGGLKETGFGFGISRGVSPLVTLNNTNIYPLFAMRLNSNYLHATIKLLNFNINCTSTATYNWYLILNPTVTGTALSFTQITNSSVDAQVNTTNATTVSGGTVLLTGTSSQTNEAGVNIVNATDFGMGSTIAGVADIVVLAVQRATGTTETFYAALNWRAQQ